MLEICGHVNSHKLFILYAVLVCIHFNICDPRRAEFQKYILQFAFLNLAVSSCHNNRN